MSDDEYDRLRNMPPEAARVLGRLSARVAPRSAPASSSNDLGSILPGDVLTELRRWIDERPAPRPDLAGAVSHILGEWAQFRKSQRE